MQFEIFFDYIYNNIMLTFLGYIRIPMNVRQYEIDKSTYIVYE